MPRFYFHLFNDETTIDEEGRALDNQSAARTQALSDARHMAAESVLAGHLTLSHYVEVAGEDAEPLFRVTFGEAVRVR